MAGPGNDRPELAGNCRHSRRGAHLCGSRGRRRRPHASRRRRLKRAAACKAAAHGPKRVRSGRPDRRAGQRRARRGARAQALRAQADLAFGRCRKRSGQALAQALAVALCARGWPLRQGASCRARARAQGCSQRLLAQAQAATRPQTPARRPLDMRRRPPAQSSAQDTHCGHAHAVAQAASRECPSLACAAGHRRRRRGGSDGRLPAIWEMLGGAGGPAGAWSGSAARCSVPAALGSGASPSSAPRSSADSGAGRRPIAAAAGSVLAFAACTRGGCFTDCTHVTQASTAMARRVCGHRQTGVCHESHLWGVVAVYCCNGALAFAWSPSSI